MEGWVKLYRKSADWQWSRSPKHIALFWHLLIRANHKETKWRTETIKPGQLLTGRKQLSDWSGLSEREVRTVLKDLKNSGEIDQQTTRHYSIISITKWSDYQQSDQQTTSWRPANDQLTTTSKNANNENNENKDTLPRPDAVVQLWNDLLSSQLGYSHGIGVGKHLENFVEARQFFNTYEKWQNYFIKISKTAFMHGQNDRQWKATLQWAVNYDNALKVLDGAFDKDSSVKKALDAVFGPEELS